MNLINDLTSVSSSSMGPLSSPSRMVTSAFASVSEMANKLAPSFNLSNEKESDDDDEANDFLSSLSNTISNSNNHNTAERKRENSTSSSPSSSTSPSSVLLKAFSFTRTLSHDSTANSTNNNNPLNNSIANRNNSSTDSDLAPSSNQSTLSESFTSAASSVLNKINPFDSIQNTLTNNDFLSTTKTRLHASKSTKRKLFAKIESHSLSISSAFFGNNKANSFSKQEEVECDDLNEESFTSTYSSSLSSAAAEATSVLNHKEMIVQRAMSEGESTPSFSSTKRKQQPVGTLEYQVETNDTIEKIALKWNTIPSEIQHLNRLVTRMIFPGQILYVPDPNYVPPTPIASPPNTPQNSQVNIAIINELNTLEHTTVNNSSASINQNGSKKSATPSSSSSGGGFSLFKWRSTPTPKPGHVEKQKRNSITETNSVNNNNNNINSNKRPSISRHTLSEEEAKQLDEECMQRFIKVNCKIVTRTKGCFEGVLIITPSAVMFDPIEGNVISNDESTSSLNGSSDNRKSLCSSTVYNEANAIIPVEMISNVIMYEDISLKDVQEYFEYQDQIDKYQFDLEEQVEHQQVATSKKQENDAELNRKNSSSAKTSFFYVESDSSDAIKEKCEILPIEKEASDATSNTTIISSSANADLQTTLNKNTENGQLVVGDEKVSSLNANADSSSSKSSNSSSISCYLCIKVNKDKDFISCPLDRKMKNRIVSEFWFQINDTGTDKICAFFLEWKNDPTSMASNQDFKVPVSGFRLVKEDEKLADLIADNLLTSHLSLKLNKSFSTTNRLINKGTMNFVKDWEVVNLQELESKIKTEMLIESEYKTLPCLIGKSSILKEDHLRKLNVNLIPRAIGYNWVLTFSTDVNGFSLNTLYRLLSEIDGPCLVAVMDTSRNVFGAMASCKLYPYEHYYGTGETFLFTFYPSFKVYKWTGENNFFIRGTSDSIGFGCAEGYHGLWMDGDLLNGHTQKSKTFDNEMLTSNEYFTIASLEVWTFSD